MATGKEFPAGGTGDNTVIGPSILISGKLSGDEDLTVRGRVEGELSLSRTLIVEPSGIVKANVAVKNAIVSGVVVGNIAATESVELTQEGRMVGDIRAPRVIIVDGASFRGRVDMGDASPRPEGEKKPSSVRPVLKTTISRPPSKPLPPKPAAKRDDEKPAPPPPPAPVLVGEGGKKKVVVKKKR